MIYLKDIELYRISDFNDAITYTRLLAHSSRDHHERARAKVACAYIDMMDLLSPGWRNVAYETLISNYKKANLTEIPSGNVGFDSVSDIKLTFSNFVINPDHLSRVDRQ